MNYKIKVDGNIEELTSLFIALGCKYFNHTVSEKNYMIVEDGKGFFCKLKSNFKKSECREISIDQLKDMVVLKRNDANDSNASEENCLYDLYLTDSGDLYFYHCGKNKWILSNISGDEDYYKSLKPIEKPMKEFLNKLEDGTYKLVLLDSGADGVDVEFFPDEKHSHYKKDISHLDTLDIYRVTELFNPHSCGAHIAKKALCSGQRGHKDLLTDIQDIIDTAERWKEMLIEDGNP